MATSVSHVQASVERFSGFAALYDSHRPRPPAAIIDLLTQICACPRPRLVIDIGCGTGLSTLIWAERAEEVVGVEPSPDMRRLARARATAAGAANVRFAGGVSTATGLAGGGADVVTCSQALHWMEPEPTFVEVARILRPAGVFAAYDCDWPPAFNWEVERTYAACIARAHSIERERRLSPDLRRWPKGGHLERIRNSGRFRYVREVALHHVEAGGVERLVGLALSQGGIETLLKGGISEQEIGLGALRETARRSLGDAILPWYWSYRVRLGVK